MQQLRGWRGIGPNQGRFVHADEAFDHVTHEVGILDFHETAPLADEFRHMLIDWYFSGDWVGVWEDEEN